MNSFTDNSASGAADRQSERPRTILVDSDRHDQVMFHTDGDRFITKVAEAANACARAARERDDQEKSREDSEKLLEMINQWSSGIEAVKYAVFGIEYTGMVCEFITVGDERDFDVADRIGDFALEIFDQFPGFPIAFHTFPESAWSLDEVKQASDRRALIYDSQHA